MPVIVEMNTNTAIISQMHYLEVGGSTTELAGQTFLSMKASINDNRFAFTLTNNYIGLWRDNGNSVQKSWRLDIGAGLNANIDMWIIRYKGANDRLAFFAWDTSVGTSSSGLKYLELDTLNGVFVFS